MKISNNKKERRTNTQTHTHVSGSSSSICSSKNENGKIHWKLNGKSNAMKWSEIKEYTILRRYTDEQQQPRNGFANNSGKDASNHCHSCRRKIKYSMPKWRTRKWWTILRKLFAQINYLSVFFSTMMNATNLTLLLRFVLEKQVSIIKRKRKKE